MKGSLRKTQNWKFYNLEGGITAWQNSGGAINQSGGPKVLPLDRQVLLLAGSFVLTASLLGYFVSPKFFLLASFFGLGLIVAGWTGFCGGALILAKMPWNQNTGAVAGTACSWKPKI